MLTFGSRLIKMAKFVKWSQLQIVWVKLVEVTEHPTESQLPLKHIKQKVKMIYTNLGRQYTIYIVDNTTASSTQESTLP